MKRLMCAFSLLLAAGCGKDAETKSEAGATKTTVPKATASDDELKSAPEAPRLTLTAQDFQTERVLEGVSPEAPRLSPPVVPPVTEADPEEPSQKHPQLRFTRVKGGDGFYCGTTNEGPVQCWGSRTDRLIGTFIDLAIADDGICAISASGQISCEGAGAPTGSFERIHASGKNTCAVAKSGEVKCWGPSPLQPPSGLRAEFITVGDGFACAADPTHRLVCWGETAPLMLPIDSLRVRDIAAGAEFLCALGEGGDTKCFGKGPRLPEGKYSTLNAGFDQVCGIKVDGGNECAGTVTASIEGETRRFAIARKSVCAHLAKNKLRCHGPDGAEGPDVPLDTSKTLDKPAPAGPKPVDTDTWLAFLELFPQQKLPQSFTLTTEVTLGDRVPAKFESLIGDDPNRFRTGVGFELPHHTVGLTLFDLQDRVLVIFLFQGRKKVDEFALLKWTRTTAETVESDDGTGLQERTAVSRTSVLTKDGTVEAIELEGTEKTKLVKKHLDGSRPVSSVDCEIKRSTWVTEVSPSGKSARKQAKVKRDYGAVDQKGCESRPPFD